MENEKRLIAFDKLRGLKYERVEFSDYREGWNDAIDTICTEVFAPAVDAVEVVHGRWLYDSGSGKYFCSACDENALSFKKDTLYGGDLYEVCLTDYCPNCGAKMDGGNEDV